MRKISILLSLLVLVALVLTACGGEEDTTTDVPASPPPVTADSNDDLSTPPTESPTGAATQEGTTTEAPGVPVTGDVNPARLSNQLDFSVWSQDGEQIGEVEDMVLDLDNTRVAYVVVNTAGFLDFGDRMILVPWEALELQTGTGDTTGGQQNAFVFQDDLEVFRTAPDADLVAILPETGQPAGDWDVDIRVYWESGGTTGAAGTPTGEGTAVPDMTATGDQATATPGTGQGAGVPTATAGTDQGTGTNPTLQGVVLATEALGAPITLSPGQGDGQGTDTGTSQSTATPGTDQAGGVATATATAGTGSGVGVATATGPAADVATATPGTGTGHGVGNIEGLIDDLMIDVDTGEILYVVVDVALDDGERWIPVPVSLIQWDAANGAFLLNANPAALRDAPAFENGQYPDTTTSGWNTEFDTFWQNNPGGTGTRTGSGGGTGTQATATPTP